MNLKSTLQNPSFIQSIYKDMLLYRRFEEAVGKAYNNGKFAGFCHLHIGQEAVCAGVQKALRPTDYVISAYRSHTQAIAKGIDPKVVMAEILGKEVGSAKGKGGSMHMFDREKRFLGGHGIVGGQTPLAAGVGFKIRYRNEDDVCVCYLGDGAANQGQFFEALNLAATWKLPVLYVIENNQFGMGTDFRRVTSVDRLWKRALAFDMDGSDCDGMNVLAVYENVSRIVENMRKSKRPYLLEALTYRFRGHSVSDPGNYRTKEDLQKYVALDPLLQLQEFMLNNQLAQDEDFNNWDLEVRNYLKEIEKFADDANEPPLEAAHDHIFMS